MLPPDRVQGIGFRVQGKWKGIFPLTPTLSRAGEREIKV
jgi:hypothetical protein